MREYEITELCSVIRSKQAGPFRLTFDLMFKSEEIYMAVKSLEYSPELISKLYGVSQDKITHFVFYDPGWSVKITMVRPRVAGLCTTVIHTAVNNMYRFDQTRLKEDLIK